MDEIDAYLLSRAENGIISFAVQQGAATCFNMGLSEVEDRILSLGQLPMRYARNSAAISPEKQKILFRSTVAVAGCGGIGGYVVEELARLGVGTLIIIDPDVFEEHNLNRQVHATFANLGAPKVAAAASRIEEINPAVTTITHQDALSEKNGPDLLSGAKLVIDALDNISHRIVLADLCEQIRLPLVHGSVAGWYGQVLTQYPGERTLQRILGQYKRARGVEQELGTPAFLPALVASLEVAEAVKVLLGEGATLRNSFLSVNLLDMEMVTVPILG